MYEQSRIQIGKSIHVVDGDTIYIKKDTLIKIRLQGIDAPEKDQPFGMESMQLLAQCLGHAKKIVIISDGRDQYNRLLAKVIADGVDCNLYQIKQGAAWHYKIYENQQSLIDRVAYSNAENLARKAEHGLWLSKNPIPPWDWRKKFRCLHAESPACI